MGVEQIALNVGKTITNSIKPVGKHKIPRYLYHMTNKQNYESIVRDGMIKTSRDIIFGEGVFTAELSNFFKRWRCNKQWGNTSLQERLIQQVAKGKDEIVILKIPTEKLNPELLKVRSQNTLFNWGLSDKFKQAKEEITKIMDSLPEEKDNWVNKIISLAKEIIKKTEEKTIATHLSEGFSASTGKLLKQKKQAIEYIYRDNIPISNLEKIGEVNIAELRKTAEYNPAKPVRSIFTALLKDTPEVHGAKLLDC